MISTSFPFCLFAWQTMAEGKVTKDPAFGKECDFSELERKHVSTKTDSSSQESNLFPKKKERTSRETMRQFVSPVCLKK